MHASVMTFLAEWVEWQDLSGKSVLDVGSLDVNGSPRHLFHGPYWGIDLRSGPGVNQVADAHDLPDVLDRRDYDVVICAEMLEHDPRPWLTLSAMREVLAPGGLLLLTCRGFDERGCFPVHEHPVDLWRFSRAAIVMMLQAAGWASAQACADPEAPGVFATARAATRADDRPIEGQMTIDECIAKQKAAVARR